MLKIEDLKIYYESKKGLVKAVDGVSIEVGEQETIGLVGESGSGKSTLGFGILKILPKTAQITGRILLDNINLVSKTEKEMQKIRGKEISMIFQDPMTSLNPIMKVKDHFLETIKTHIPDIEEDKALEMTENALKAVGINPNRINEYPFQFSGGMRQRVMIALSLVLNPKLVIADEPTTSLDVIVQAQILEVLKELKEKFQMSMILITHDLGVVAETADKIAVMYAGHVVEFAENEKIYYGAKHPYTKALLESIPNTDIDDLTLKYIPGNPPDLVNPSKGCRFAPRCPFAKDICFEEEPPVFEIDGSKVKCWIYKGDENGDG
ncbi:MAG: ABC transporter ATP-binding protein [Thermotogaceae bacterium]|nr:ABC transporter ATP-binding protein [Thermotogaceae bacterium]